jgi:hypothetical protein
LAASISDELRFVAPTLGGGGTTFAAMELFPERFSDETLGGGGTTSCVPKSLPMMLLTNDGLLACVGGGGTTDGEDAEAPLSSRRRSRLESVDGGGATTEGAGRFNFALSIDSRSGALTGGGTTATLVIRTRVAGTARLAVSGAGGITPELRAGAERARSSETCVDAGAITFAFNEGAMTACCRETLGAGAMMEESRRGAINACSEGAIGAGGTTSDFRDGNVRDLSAEIPGAGGTIVVRVSPPRECSRVTFAGAGAITFAESAGAISVECNPCADGDAGIGGAFGIVGADLKASKFATACAEDGNLRLGASTTFSASDTPRAT